MSKYQFTVSVILIQPNALAIGPFTFDLSNQLPSGDDISACTVTSSLGGTDTTANLIADSSLAANVVSVYFDYPGNTGHGDHKLTFAYTLQSGATDEADFYKVMVADS